MNSRSSARTGGRGRYRADTEHVNNNAVFRSPNMGNAGQPSKVRVQLKYYQRVAVSTAASQTQVFRANGPFDPDVTGTGSQPYNYDDYALLYNRYRVLGSTIQWMFADNSSGEFRIVGVPTNSTTPFTTVDDAIAAPYSRWRTAVSATQLNDGSKGNFITQRATTLAILGENSRDRFESLISTVPSDQWYWWIRLDSPGGGTITGILHAVIIYDMEFFDRAPESIDLVERKIDHATKKLYVLRRAQAEEKNGKQESSETKFVSVSEPGYVNVPTQAPVGVMVPNTPQAGNSFRQPGTQPPQLVRR